MDLFVKCHLQLHTDSDITRAAVVLLCLQHMWLQVIVILMGLIAGFIAVSFDYEVRS